MSTLQNDIIALRVALSDISKCLDSMDRRIQEESGIATGYTRPHIQSIFEVVCNHFKIPESAMHSRSRRASIVLPRQVSMHIARELTKYSLGDIAKCFRPDMDGGTIIHGCKRIDDQLNYDSGLRAIIGTLTAECARRIQDSMPATTNETR